MLIVPSPSRYETRQWRTPWTAVTGLLFVKFCSLLGVYCISTLNMSVPWRSIPCRLSQVRLDVVLSAGQSFRWQETKEKEWTSVLQGRVWTVKQDDQHIHYRVYEPETEAKRNVDDLNLPAKTLKCAKHDKKGTEYTKIDQKSASKNIKREDYVTTGIETTEDIKLVGIYEAILRDYFQLDVDLQDLYEQWSEADTNFSKVAKAFNGIRTLHQDPVENLFSFICSSNNNIPRITGMVEKVCVKYGKKLMEVDGIDYYSFPSISALAGPAVEQELRTLGFGYRAKFVNKSAQCILENGGKEWLYSLRNDSYEDAHAALCKLPGIGSKVADCVCLMSLDKHDAIPVDTHVWQITVKYYMPGLTKTKTLTDKLYRQIGDHYRMLFGKYAGWAHSVLFSADLKRFQDLHLVAAVDEKNKTTKTNKRGNSTKEKKKSPKKTKKDVSK